MSVKKLYNYNKKMSEEGKKQSHILFSNSLNLFIENKSNSINKVFIEGNRDNFTLYVFINNVKYYFYGIYYPVTKKHVFSWYTDYKSYYKFDSKSSTILVKDVNDPFKFLTIENNNFAHTLKIDNNVINFLKNNIFYFNDIITQQLLKKYFMINIVLFRISIIIIILILFIIIYFKFIKKNIPKINDYDDYQDNYDE